jgi:hypothetical protein
MSPELSSRALQNPAPRQRAGRGASFALLEVPPQLVVDGELVDGGLLAQDVTPVGQMRETCPYCLDVPLQLVLRSDHVILPHLFCQRCTRCFEATDPDGRWALMFSGLPIY